MKKTAAKIPVRIHESLARYKEKNRVSQIIVFLNSCSAKPILSIQNRFSLGEPAWPVRSAFCGCFFRIGFCQTGFFPNQGFVKLWFPEFGFSQIAFCRIGFSQIVFSLNQGFAKSCFFPNQGFVKLWFPEFGFFPITFCRIGFSQIVFSLNQGFAGSDFIKIMVSPDRCFSKS